MSLGNPTGGGLSLSGGRPVDPQKVAVYIRWSTEEQGQGTTLEIQREACEYYCRSQGWAFRPDLLFVDAGCSAGDLNRPALTRLREAVRAGQVECVVVYKLDRLSRNLLDCVWLVRQEWADRVALYSTRENFDTNSPVGQMVFNILVSFAEFERNVIRERTLSGKRKRAEQGRNAGQRYPYGYRKGPDGGWALDGWDEERQCLAGPAAVVRRIFSEYLAGAGTVTIAQRLNAEGIPAPMGGPFRFGTVIRMLDNPMYAGRYAYGKQKGRVLSLVEGAVPAIIPPGEFDAVQRLRQERTDRPPRELHSPFLLSGIACCRRCGGHLTGATGRRKRYYVCSGRAAKRACDCAWIDAEKLEGALLRELRAFFAGPALCGQLDQLLPELQQRLAEYGHAVAMARAEVAALGRKRKRLDEAFFAGALDSRVYSDRALRLEAEQAGAAVQLERAEAALREAGRAAREVSKLGDMAGCVDAWSELSFEERKQAIREAVATLQIYQAPPPRPGREGNPNPLLVEWQPQRA